MSNLSIFIVFVCLFICLEIYRPTEEFFTYGDVTMTGEGLQILTYARHSWPLSSEGSLACLTYTVTQGIRL